MSQEISIIIKKHISDLTKDKLFKLCKKYELSTKGRKDDIVKRIKPKILAEDIVPYFYSEQLKTILEEAGFSKEGVKDELKKRVLSLIKPQKGETNQKVFLSDEQLEDEHPGVETKQEVIPDHLHKEIKEKLVELGRVFGWYSQEEYKDKGIIIDVVWKEREQLPIHKAFEVQHKGDVKGALVNLQHAHDCRADIFLIVTDEKDRIKAEELFEGAFHNIKEFIKVISYSDFVNLYKAIISHKDIIEKMKRW